MKFQPNQIWELTKDFPKAIDNDLYIGLRFVILDIRPIPHHPHDYEVKSLTLDGQLIDFADQSVLAEALKLYVI